MDFETESDLLKWAWGNGYLFCELDITWRYFQENGRYFFVEMEHDNDKRTES